MSQLSLAFDAFLMIRAEQGRCMPATAKQILDTARKVIDQNVQRGPGQRLPDREAGWF